MFGPINNLNNPLLSVVGLAKPLLWILGYGYTICTHILNGKKGGLPFLKFDGMCIFLVYTYLSFFSEYTEIAVTREAGCNAASIHTE